MRAFLVALVPFSVALYAWGIWVARRHPGRIYQLAARGVLVGIVFGLGGLAFAEWRLAQAQEAARGADPANAAVELARAISKTVVLAAVPISLGNLILLACIVVFVLGTVARHKE